MRLSAQDTDQGVKRIMEEFSVPYSEALEMFESVADDSQDADTQDLIEATTAIAEERGVPFSHALTIAEEEHTACTQHAEHDIERIAFRLGVPAQALVNARQSIRNLRAKGLL